MMRDIRHIVIHCTATPQSATIASIQRYWRQVLGWRSPGYHVIIPPNGTPVRLAADSRLANGVRGHNANALHVSYIGGVDSKGKPMDNRTDEQKQALRLVVKNWLEKYPDAAVLGHRDFPGVTKACPSFDAGKEYASIAR